VDDLSTTSATVGAVTSPRWLDERETRAWRGTLRAQAELARRLNRQLQRDSGLSSSDYEVLVDLSEADDGRLRAYELSRALQWEKSRLSHHLSRMEARGLVCREDCVDDARGAWVCLTPEGRAAIEAAAPRHLAEVRRLFVDLLTPAQLDVLADVADAVLAACAADDDLDDDGRGDVAATG
jgi:DNA-binding MarR family transcriptional regulator